MGGETVGVKPSWFGESWLCQVAFFLNLFSLSNSYVIQEIVSFGGIRPRVVCLKDYKLCRSILIMERGKGM